MPERDEVVRLSRKFARKSMDDVAQLSRKLARDSIKKRQKSFLLDEVLRLSRKLARDSIKRQKSFLSREESNSAVVDETDLGPENRCLSLLQFLRMLEAQRLIPEMLMPWDVMELFRRIKPEDGVLGVDGMAETVIPPDPCPASVFRALDLGAALHNEGLYEQSLMVYREAYKLWLEAMHDDFDLDAHEELWLEAMHHDFDLDAHEELEHLPLQKIYFSIVLASVLLSAGCPEKAMEQYLHAEAELKLMPSDHPNVSILLSCRGFALHILGHLESSFEHFVKVCRCALHSDHPNVSILLSCRGFTLHILGHLESSFEHLVKAKVMREEHLDLGPGHVDTALVKHNLACVLDQLGKAHKALELLTSAHRVFTIVLGNRHPRTIMAARNIALVKGKCSKPDMKYYIPENGSGGRRGAEIPKWAQAKGQAGRGVIEAAAEMKGLIAAEAARDAATLEVEAASRGPAGRGVIEAAAEMKGLIAAKAARDAAALEVEAASRGPAGRGGIEAAAEVQRLIASKAARDAAELEVEAASRGPVKPLTPQQRLQAFQLRTHEGEGSAPTTRKQHRRDLDYIGGGMHSAPADVLELYEKIKGEIAANSTGTLNREENVIIISRHHRTPEYSSRTPFHRVDTLTPGTAPAASPSLGQTLACSSSASLGKSPSFGSRRRRAQSMQKILIPDSVSAAAAVASKELTVPRLLEAQMAAERAASKRDAAAIGRKVKYTPMYSDRLHKLLTEQGTVPSSITPRQSASQL
eukprot:gene25906-11582_t